MKWLSQNTQGFILALVLVSFCFGTLALLIIHPIANANGQVVCFALGSIATPAIQAVIKRFFPDKHINQNANDQNIQQ